jgi:hypothetical protein
MLLILAQLEVSRLLHVIVWGSPASCEINYAVRGIRSALEETFKNICSIAFNSKNTKLPLKILMEACF